MGGLTISQKERAAKKGHYPGWHDLVAGAAAGAGARILTHPLDLIRIRRQLAAYQEHQNVSSRAKKQRPVSSSMWSDLVHVVQNEGGIRGLFRGNVAALNLWVSYTAVQFYAYGITKKYFQSTFPDNNNRTLVAFCSGASAGVAATVSTYPLDLCRTIFAARGASVEKDSAIAAAGEVHGPSANNNSTTTAIKGGAGSNAAATAATAKEQAKQHVSSSSPKHQFRPPKSTIEFATNLYKHRGLRGFFAGCTPTIIQIIPYMGCSFAIYDALTRGDRRVELSAYAGSIAGAVSKALVYPMDTVKKRMQAQAFFGQHGYTDIMDCVTTIYRVEGPWAFYSGLVPSVLKTALAAGLSFAFFRSTKNLLESMHDDPFSHHDPPTRKSLQRRMSGH